jgi:hypothetical protein
MMALMPVILAVREAELRIVVQGQAGGEEDGLQTPS